MRLTLLALTLAGCCFDPSKPAAKPVEVTAPAPAPKPPEPTPLEKALSEMTPEDDAKRVALVDESKSNGWIRTVDWDRREVVVGLGFGELDFKLKEAVAWNIVLVGLRKEGAKKGTFLGANYDLDLLDPKTNKLVGSYSTLWGKLKLE